MRNTAHAAGGRAAVFAPLDVGKRADAVVRRLSEGIHLGLLAPDEQLPSETDLAEAFGVSAVTVREALTALRGQGLLVTRRGRNGGSFVRGGATDEGAETAVLRERLRAVSPSELRDLADHYGALASTCAALAAERAGELDVALIADSVAALAGAGDLGARRRAESRFHVELAAAAQSPRLTRAVISMQAEIGPLLWPSRGESDVVARHRGILDAVAAGDGPGARGLAAAHLSTALARASTLQLTFLGEPDGESDPPSDPVAAVIERVATICESTFAAIEGIRGAAEQLLRPLAGPALLRPEDVEPISRVVRPLLDTDGTPLVGAGLVLEPGLVEGAGHWMEWWHRTPDGSSVERLEVDLDPSATAFYDYTVLPWFTVPRRTGARHVVGPYVDHLCTQEYTLTFTAPISVGGRFLGVVGADIVDRWLERTLLPQLGAIRRPAALVNDGGRVAVANDPALVVGSVVPGGELHHLDRLPLALLIR
ncbi:FCD domain-containing protein [Pseudonocardia sp. CA-107938]|uniref:FCD domain-containing protein n=1 Tax=Pseudonocardia sp. CA-107938 TaxID=3240021 RepID=UPI003D8A59D0